jgi:hypothetical protein
MEAAVAEKEAVMTESNDGRLDELGERVDRIEKKVADGFVRVERKMDEGFARMDARFEKVVTRMDARFDLVNERFESLHRILFQAAWGFAIALIGLIAVVLTKL